MRLKRSTSLLGVAVILVSGVPALGQAPTSSVQAKPNVPPGFEALRSTAELTGPVLASGDLTGDTEDAKVFVYAIPPIPRDVANGQRLPAEVPAGIGVSRGTTFRVVADPSVDLTRFVNDSGVVDFRAIGVTPEHVGMTIFSRRLDARGRILEPRHSGPEMVVSGDGKQVTRVDDPNAITLDVRHKLLEAPEGTTATAEPSDCQVDYNHRPLVMIGAGFHRTRGVRLTLTYWRQSTSQLGVGINLNGGGWEASGSVERENSSSTGIKWQTRKEQDQFHYTRYQYKVVRCGWIWMNGWGYWRSQEARPEHLMGGNYSGKPRWYPVTRPENCQPYKPGGAGPELVVDSSIAVTYNKGIRLPFIKLSSRSGFNENTKLAADVGRRRHICGWTGPTGTRPGLLVVGLYGR